MKKPTNKSNKPGKDKFTVTEVGTLVEQLRGEFRVFGEDLITVKEDVGSLKVMVAGNTEKITSLETAVTSLKVMVAQNTERITALEAIVRNVVLKIDDLIKSIDNLAKTKVDNEKFISLEKRVSALETKLAVSK